MHHWAAKSPGLLDSWLLSHWDTSKKEYSNEVLGKDNQKGQQPEDSAGLREKTTKSDLSPVWQEARGGSQRAASPLHRQGGRGLR